MGRLSLNIAWTIAQLAELHWRNVEFKVLAIWTWKRFDLKREFQIKDRSDLFAAVCYQWQLPTTVFWTGWQFATSTHSPYFFLRSISISPALLFRLKTSDSLLKSLHYLPWPLALQLPFAGLHVVCDRVDDHLPSKVLGIQTPFLTSLDW